MTIEKLEKANILMDTIHHTEKVLEELNSEYGTLLLISKLGYIKKEGPLEEGRFLDVMDMECRKFLIEHYEDKLKRYKDEFAKL